MTSTSLIGLFFALIPVGLSLFDYLQEGGKIRLASVETFDTNIKVTSAILSLIIASETIFRLIPTLGLLCIFIPPLAISMLIYIHSFQDLKSRIFRTLGETLLVGVGVYFASKLTIPLGLITGIFIIAGTLRTKDSHAYTVVSLTSFYLLGIFMMF